MEITNTSPPDEEGEEEKNRNQHSDNLVAESNKNKLILIILLEQRPRKEHSSKAIKTTNSTPFGVVEAKCMLTLKTICRRDSYPNGPCRYSVRASRVLVLLHLRFIHETVKRRPDDVDNNLEPNHDCHP